MSRGVVNPWVDIDSDFDGDSGITPFDNKSIISDNTFSQQGLASFLSYTFNEYSSVNLFNLPKKPVKLFDVFVSTATNYYLDVDIKDRTVKNVRIVSEMGYIPETYSGASKNEECTDAQKGSIINKITEHICAADEYYYPDKGRRPLILSAPYTDGTKKKYWALNIFDVISLYDKVAVLGSPGIGKSTALRYIALELIANVCGKIDGDNQESMEYLSSKLFTEKYVPVYIEFGKLTKWFGKNGVHELSLENIVKYINNCCNEYSSSNEYVEIPYTDFSFDADKLLFIFDGIDEISQSNNKDELFSKVTLETLVNEIKEKYPASRMLFSSRIGEYGSYQMEEFSVCGLIDMSEMLSIQLAKKVGAVLKPDSNFKPVELISAMQDKGLKADIIGNPMLLTLYTAVFIKNESGDLLANRAQILREGIDLLLERWSDIEESKPEIMKGLEDPKKRDDLYVRLETLAYMQQDDVMDEKALFNFLFYNENNMMSLNESNKMLLDYLASRVGLIVPLGQFKYKFAHKSFHSYLAARYIISKDDKIKELLLNNIEKKLETSHEATSLVIDLLFDRIFEPKYMDYLCGIVNALLDDINIKSHYCVWFAAQILLRHNADLFNYFSLHHSAVIAKLKSALLDCFRDVEFPSDKRIECGRFLGALGDIRRGVDCFRNEAGVVLPEIVWCKVPYGGFKMGIDDATVKVIRDMNWGKSIDFSREKRSDNRDVCVEVGEFEIGKYPITVAQFIPFLDDVNGYNNESWYSWSANAKEYFQSRKKKFQSRNESIFHTQSQNDDEYFHGMLLPAEYRTNNMPITHVHFYDAVAYCKWLSALTGDTIRLPSEMEWEYLAKTLCPDVDHKIFAWTVDYSSNWDDQFVAGECNCLESKIGSICPVGAFSDTDDVVPVDLIGNAWEWTQSVFSATLDPIHGNMLICTEFGDLIEDKMNRNTLISVRGGSLHNGFNCMRVSFRGRDPLGGDAKDRHSFRIVRKKMNYLQQNYEMEHFNREDKRSFSKIYAVQYGGHECMVETEEGYGAQVQHGNTITIMYNVKKNGEWIDQQDAVSFVIGNGVVHKFIEDELLNNHKVACNLTFSNVCGGMLFENGYANRIEKSDSLTIWIHIKDIQES